MLAPSELLQAFARTKDEGEAWWWMGTLAVIKATGAETGGRVTLIEITEAPGAMGPLHVHHNEDEGFLIFEGSATFTVGDKVIKAGPGDFLFGPKDIPHRYDVGPEGVRMLYIFTPSGFEGLIRETGTPAKTRTLPPADVIAPDDEKTLAIIKKYGCEILG